MPGKYVWQTYQEVYDIVIKLGNSLRSCGVEEQAKCGIYGANSPEWIISMEACNAHGLYCVPLYDTLGAGAVEFIITHSEVSIVFVEEKKISELFKTCPKATEYMKTVVSFGGVTREQKEAAETFGLVIYAWDEFLKLGEGKQFDLPIKKKSDICTIMYTSGTTGDPKGVMISNESIVTLIAGVIRLLKSANEALTVKDVYLSYLPLAHIFDRVIEECFIQHGAAIGFWRGDVKLLIEDLGELKPTIFCAVPRVLDRVYSGLQQKLAAGGFFKKFMFDSAFSFKYGHMKKGQSHVEASPLCDKLVFSKVKQGLGGNVRIILSGAAPLASHVESFLRVVACCHVLQGYGLTESCAGTFVSLPDRLDMLGTVGPPVPNVDIRLESVPEMEYDALASTPRGEICIRGKTLFSGYYKREDLTKEVLIDGWLHTGDVGEWQPNGSMKIIDRKKNIFKLSQGEYVAVENLENIYGEVQAVDSVSDVGEWQPNGSMKIIDRKKNIFKLSQGEYVAVENLENIYGEVQAVDSVWVYGNSFESFLIAVANPNQHILEKWAAENGVSGDYNALCQNAKAKEFILGELVKMGKEKKMKGFEIIKAVHLDPVPFDMERDLLTPTYKKKRPQLLKHYQCVIDEMYKTTNESLASRK
ncbi:hypothetical protein F2Q70_00034981 [Brassica cretica]|uniref:Long-chain-fatty-acid--CoA ligase n=1 Tax=Brassica cretica TaxID=69181 RepID=A0A8S9JRW5_BRACR|nr:hypothetical protein F2Q70_00034981 [Brassica cretica]